jgi:hypothetical protein
MNRKWMEDEDLSSIDKKSWMKYFYSEKQLLGYDQSYAYQYQACINARLTQDISRTSRYLIIIHPRSQIKSIFQ